MIDRNFAVFILTHGRADNVITYKTLKKQGYAGKIYIVIDDEDDQEERYREIYGDQVVQFCKSDYDGKFDIMDNDNDRRVVVYARNAVFDIAKDLGFDYFVVLDDDYKEFQFRYEDGKKLRSTYPKNLDRLFNAMFEFLDKSGAKTVCMGQGGDLIGGVNSGTWKQQLIRKAMNVWFFKTDNRIEIIGRINEDTNTYVVGGTRGELFFTILRAIIVQLKTQSNPGGLTDIYLANGTYRKSFYSVMCAPSCVTIGAMGGSHLRLHHHISWNNCTPKILDERWRKEC
jgi:hypothetical protein